MIKQSYFWVYMKNLKAAPWRDICTLVCINSIIHNSPEVEATQASVDRWMSERTVVHTYDGILLKFKKNGNPVTCHNMDEPWRHCAKWNTLGTKNKRTNTVWFHLHEAAKVVKLIETESRMVFARDWEEEEVWSCLMESSVLLDEKVLELCCKQSEYT